MISIGLVGGIKCWHGMVFSQLINGYDRKRAVELNWRPMLDESLGDGEIRVTHVWDPVQADAEEVAEVTGIENVVSEYSEMVGKVDGVLVIDDLSLKHQQRALPFLEAGVPVFIDKPLATSVEEAERYFDAAEKGGAALMSCSSYRFAVDTAELRGGGHDLGKIRTGAAFIKEEMGDWFFYGIHPVELVLSVAGDDIREVRNSGEKGCDVVTLVYSDGRRFMVVADEKIAYYSSFYVYGTKGHMEAHIGEQGSYYPPMLKAVVDMFRTGRSPVSRKSTMQVIRVMSAALQSREKSGIAVKLDKA